MPSSRLLPPDQRAALSSPPTTSLGWRVHVLVRAALNRHRRRWLAPLLVVVPPVGVAMVWAGATRPGHRRRWLTAAAVAWTLALAVAVVVLVLLPGAVPAGADGPADARAAAPRIGAVPSTAHPSPVVTTTTAAAVPSATVGPTATPDDARGSTGGASGTGVDGVAAGPASRSSAAPAGGTTAPVPVRAASAPASTPAGAAPSAASGRPSTAPKPRPTPQPPAPEPTPPGPKPPAPTPPGRPGPAVPAALPLTTCAAEGATARSARGTALRCSRTPIGLYWLWSQ